MNKLEKVINLERAEVVKVLEAKIEEIKNEPKTINEADYLDYRGVGLNSIELLTLIVYLEEYFHFELEDTDLSLACFTVVEDLLNFVIKLEGME
jgi:acyl carrier protein